MSFISIATMRKGRDIGTVEWWDRRLRAPDSNLRMITLIATLNFSGSAADDECEA